MNVKTIQSIGRNVAMLLHDYHNGPSREMLIDPVLYGYLRGSGRSVERQYCCHLPGAKRSPRIDFRVKGPNPILIEFAVRPPIGGSQLYGSQNKSELWKLCRFSNVEAKLRALLLIDLYQEPMDRDSLKQTYDAVYAGRGKFERYPVKVIYAHANDSYSFKWSPFKIG